jgi:hypothetical protein
MANSSLQIPDDFFSNLTESKTTKFLFVTFAMLASLINSSLFFFCVWFEKHGADNRQTLINKFATSSYWCAIQYFVFVLPSDMIPFIFGSLPRSVCLALRIIKLANFCQLLLYFDLIAVSRYFYIFVLKNPAAFNDEFWAFFLNIWATMACLITKTAYHLAIPQQAIAFYICCGIDPKVDNYVTPR